MKQILFDDRLVNYSADVIRAVTVMVDSAPTKIDGYDPVPFIQVWVEENPDKAADMIRLVIEFVSSLMHSPKE